MSAPDGRIITKELGSKSYQPTTTATKNSNGNNDSTMVLQPRYKAYTVKRNTTSDEKSDGAEEKPSEIHLGCWTEINTKPEYETKLMRLRLSERSSGRERERKTALVKKTDRNKKNLSSNNK